MQHFWLPEGKGHIRVPYMTSFSDRYDYSAGEGGFEGYPSRCGWTAEDVRGENSFGDRSVSEVAAFFQSWLYFGCAVEVLAVAGVEAETSDLLDGTKATVSTGKLPSLIRQWGRKVKEIKDDCDVAWLWHDHTDRFAWSMRQAKILKLVSSFVDEYCIPYYGPRGVVVSSKTSPLPEKVWMSIIALGYTLKQAILCYYGIEGAGGNHWGGSTLLKRRMLRKGWCPMDVSRTITALGIDGHYYMAKLWNPDVERGVSHEPCTSTQCFAQNVDEEEYRQKHNVLLGQECPCGGERAVEPVEQLLQIIERGETPVYRWDTPNRKLEIRASKTMRKGVSEPPYIAISHVWSDGMGNPTGNGLLECQLQHIQNSVDSTASLLPLESDSDDNKATQHSTRVPSYFWMDTLCVPVGDSQRMKDLRLLCIRKMAGIYGNASAVLVLSSSLRQLSFKDEDARKGLTIYLANWNNRLWTYQEGMLSRKLLFRLSDGIVEINGSTFPQVHQSIARGHFVTFPSLAFSASAGTFTVLWEILRDGIFLKGGAKSGRMQPIFPIVSDVQFRSTSRRSDETICVGTILRLKLKPLQMIEETIREEYRQRGDGPPPTKIPDRELALKRMEVFWSMVRVFPREIIFNTHKRLMKDGFRWAPESLMGIPREGFARHAEGYPAIFNKEHRCLAFRGPGIVFRTPPLVSDWSAGVEAASVDHSSDTIGHVILAIPRPGLQSLKLSLTRADSEVETDISLTGCNWAPDTAYGVILTRSINKYMREFSGTGDWVPSIGSELNDWFRLLRPDVESPDFTVDAVVGTLLSGDSGTLSCDEDAHQICIRHESLGLVTILNPTAILEPKLYANASRYEEDEIPEELATSEGSSDAGWATDSELSKVSQGSGAYASDPISDSDVNSENLELAEDYDIDWDDFPRSGSESSEEIDLFTSAGYGNSSDEEYESGSEDSKVGFNLDEIDSESDADTDNKEKPIFQDSDDSEAEDATDSQVKETKGTQNPTPIRDSEGVTQAFGVEISAIMKPGRSTKWFIY